MTDTADARPPLPGPEEVEPRFAAIVAKSLRIDPSRVTPDAYLGDLGAESIELLEISLDVEEAFGIVLPEKDILQTAEEVVGEGVLEQGGRLTDAGWRLLQARVPDLAEPAGGPPALADVRREFVRVGVWHRMIRGLIAERPQACPKCGGALATASPGRLACRACGAEHDVAAGDEINRAWVREYWARQRPA